MTRRLLMLVSMVPLLSWGADCDEDLAQCQEDCLIQFGGSVQLEMKKRHASCAKKCNKKARRCTERLLEATKSRLDEGALDNTPTSDEVDAEGMPAVETRAPKDKPPTTGAKTAPPPSKKKDDSEDDLRFQ